MSYQEKRNIVAIISTVLIFGIYCIVVYQRYQKVGVNSTNDFKFWATAILILIPVLMVFKIIIHIVFNIINKLATNEDEPKFSDELDKLIALKAVRNIYFTFILGFFISMGSQVINMPPRIMFILLGTSMIVSCIIGYISQLYFYRKGI